MRGSRSDPLPRHKKGRPGAEAPVLRAAARTRPRYATVLRRAAVVLAALAVGLVVLRPDPPRGLVVQDAGTGGLVLATGSLDLEGLAQVMDDSGHAGALRDLGDGAWLLLRPLTVGPDASLEVADSDLRLTSSPRETAALEVRGGRLLLDGATVTSWDRGTGKPDDDVTDGRAWLLARSGGRLEVLDSHLAALGYGAPDRHGVTWRDPGTGGRIQDSTFTGNYRGADVAGSDPLTVDGSVFERSLRQGFTASAPCTGMAVRRSVFRGNTGSGLLLTGGCAGARIRDSGAHDNAGQGITVTAGSDDVHLSGNEVYDNAGAGIDVHGSDGAVLEDNLVYANEVGVLLRWGAVGARLEANRLSANHTDGLRLTGGASSVVSGGNHIDFNYRAGIYVLDGTAGVLEANQLTENAVGAWLGPGSTAALVGNLIAGNSEDGVHLAATSTASVAGNRLEGNEMSAFSVALTGASALHVVANRVDPGDAAVERQRGEG
jgi:parallel beta-helix repeat protein